MNLVDLTLDVCGGHQMSNANIFSQFFYTCSGVMRALPLLKGVTELSHLELTSHVPARDPSRVIQGCTN